MLDIQSHFSISLKVDFAARHNLSDTAQETLIKSMGGWKQNEISEVRARDTGQHIKDVTAEVANDFHSIKQIVGLPSSFRHGLTHKLLPEFIDGLAVQISEERMDACVSLEAEQKTLLLLVAKGTVDQDIQTVSNISKDQLRSRFESAQCALVALSPEHAALICVAGHVARGEPLQDFVTRLEIIN